jgi:hypothetical protein
LEAKDSYLKLRFADTVHSDTRATAWNTRDWYEQFFGLKHRRYVDI